MAWKHVAATAAAVALVSVATPVATTALYGLFLPHSGTDLERSVIPASAFFVVYLGAVAAPSIAAIAVILYRRRVFWEPPGTTVGVSLQAKATAVVLAAWALVLVWAVGLAPTFMA